MDNIDKEILEKFNKADSLRMSQSYSEAVNLFNEVLKKYPSFPPALNNMALCYIGLKKFEEAEKYYLKCMEIKPVHIITINGYADLLAHTNQFQKAIPLYKESLKNNPKQEKIVEKLIHCLHEINQDNEVSILCEKAVKIYSKNRYISEIYGKTLLRLNRHKEAQNILDKTVGSIEFNEENFKVNS